MNNNPPMQKEMEYLVNSFEYPEFKPHDFIVKAHENIYGAIVTESYYDKMVEVCKFHREKYHKTTDCELSEIQLDGLKHAIVLLERETGVIREDSPSITVIG